MTPTRLLVLAMGLVLTLAVAGCDTAEERAEKHYQSALSLLEEGDVARALVELRTVFSLQPWHRDARETMADTLMAEGRIGEALGHYRRLVEQYPEALNAQLILGEYSMLGNDFEAASRHTEAALELAPDSERALSLANALAYREAVLAEDPAARREAAEAAEEFAASMPDSIISRALMVDSMMIDGELEKVLEELDELIALTPQDRRFWDMRVRAEAGLNDYDAVEATLLEMMELFPGDESLPATMIRLYSSLGDAQGAEHFLRGRIPAGEPDDAARVALIRFLAEVHGADRAIEETDAMVEEGTNTSLFRSLRASLIYDAGRRDEAIAEFEDIIATAEPSQQTNSIKVAYARLLRSEGNDVGARALVEEVLEAEPGQVDALLMQAAWLIASDRTEEAILALRRAQDQAPENPDIFTALAEAHLRNGERDLAGDMLSLAVETSGRAPVTSLRYSRFLRAQQRFLPAESVVIDALRLAPRNSDLLAELGEIYLGLEDWSRARAVEDELREIGSDTAVRLADRLRVMILRASQQSDEAISFLEELAQSEGGDRGADVAIVTSRLETGDVEGARAKLDELLAAAPQDNLLRFLDGIVASAEGQLDKAEGIYRALAAEGVGGDRVWVELVRILTAQGRSGEIAETVDAAIAAVPGSMELRWMRASLFEQAGDFDSAIGVYEELYEQDSSSAVIANNLASLLSTFRDDPESLERAGRIARRLRGTEFAPFQDTYGWIAYRQGRYDEALEYLAPAAQALQNDALVQFHLAMTHAALERRDEAIAGFERALDLAGDDPRPAFDTARQKLEELQMSDSEAPSASE